MSDLALRKAVAKCAGWEWKNVRYGLGSYAVDGDDGRLGICNPIRWDDVMAACVAAKRNGRLEGTLHVAAGIESAEQVAYRLCRLCGVEVEDD